MSPRSIRVYWGSYHGRVKFNFNWPGTINLRSVVVVTASEYDPIQLDLSIPVPGGTPRPYPPDSDYRRFVGDADFTVANISPHGPAGLDPGGVTFVVNINWRHPLPVATDITVLDPPVETLPPRR
jgi:hypothetical protein